MLDERKPPRAAGYPSKLLLAEQSSRTILAALWN
jgi:hypothetical protein